MRSEAQLYTDAQLMGTRCMQEIFFDMSFARDEQMNRLNTRNCMWKRGKESGCKKINGWYLITERQQYNNTTFIDFIIEEF